MDSAASASRVTTGMGARRLGALLVLLYAGCAQNQKGLIGVGGDYDFATRATVHDLAEPGEPTDLAVADESSSADGDTSNDDLAAPGEDAAPVSESDFAIACMPGAIACGNACADPMSDSANCGGCGLACGLGQACITGHCTCTAMSCPAGCCQGDTCQPGTADGACGMGGAACAACSTRCVNAACLGCIPGSVDTEPCGNCGSYSRTCDNTGMWGAFSACAGQGVCTPNQTQLVGCGNCGSQTNTCNASCQWVAGACGGEGACAPGTQRSEGCGNCGTETDTCGGNCQWVAGGCAAQGPCAPGQQRSEACGNCGTETDTCGGNCQWAAGGCAGQGACAPGATEAGGCDTCSHKVCDNACAWGACTLKPGNACEYQAGTHHRNCTCKTACAGDDYQFCLNTCQWSTSCACCAIANCPACE